MINQHHCKMMDITKSKYATTFVDPAIYQSTDGLSVNPQRFPVWLASSDDLTSNKFVVPSHDHSIVLIGGDQPTCLSNICSHKRSPIFRDRGDLKSVITCPIHKWTWNLNGQIRGARGFQKTCDMDLESKSVHHWNGHLFGNAPAWKHDIHQLGDLHKWLDIRNYRWYNNSKITYSYDWKIFMEIFLDLYHVDSYHPGLRSLTNCKTFDWAFGEHWSCQTAQFNRNWPSDLRYQKLYEFYKRAGYYDSAIYGAVWLGIYPNIMIEYYPSAMVVSTVWPSGIGHCINYLDFYYEKGLVERFPDLPEIFEGTFMQTADEDEEIGKRMQEGMQLSRQPFRAFNHPKEEAGYQHFHQWLETNLNQ